MWPEFASVAFQDVAKAQRNLERLARQLDPSLFGPLASLLAQSPDPDGALNLLERYAENTPPGLLEEISRVPTALTYLVAIFGYSGFLAETFLAEPELAVQFARDRNFTKLKTKEDLMQDFARFSTTNPEPWLAAQLARFKRRNYLRIGLKDVLGLSTLGETTLELSALADVILTNALLYCDQELMKRYGQPQYRDSQGRIARSGFSIISLGKLGGNELNYSSDIDLLFLYSHNGETSGGSERDSIISNKEYFVRLAHAITRTITQSTPHGEVFRVDLRLRPEGDMGDMAISLKSAQEYYEHRARDWELQMLIKARNSAGDSRLTRELMRSVEPYIYASPGDFAAVESILMSREKISRRLRESGSAAIDVKRHRGGIRDIEFVVQCLQRLYGGKDPWVRSGGTLFALRKLNDKGWLSDADFASLTASYEFLRKVEHRIQLEHGHQTHRLPTEPDALNRLARRVGMDGDSTHSPGETLLTSLQRAFARVDEIYQRVIHPRAPSAAGEVFDLKPVLQMPTEHGPHSYEATLAFLDAHFPELGRTVREVVVPERARPNVSRFFAGLLDSGQRFRMALDDLERVRKALEVIAASEYLGELLIFHPESLTTFEVGNSAVGSPAEGQLEMAFDRTRDPEPFPWAEGEELGVREKMALLRREFRSQLLRLGGADLVRLDSVFIALDRWSTLAVRSIATALEIAWSSLRKGECDPRRSVRDLPMVVLALGRLGLYEYDLGSDVDLVFVVERTVAADEVHFWTRLAEKTIEVLSSYTRDGTVFAVDTRLRPRGQEGELVVTEEALLNYMAQEAHVWEALTYMKAAPVAGNPGLGRRVIAGLTARLVERFATYPDLENELRRMRRRLEKERVVPSSNTKTAFGGYYDVDFALSYLRLRHRVEISPPANTTQQLGRLNSAGILGQADAATLMRGAEFLRAIDHAVRLVTGRPASGLPEQAGHAEAVQNLARIWGLVQGSDPVAGRLREVQQEIRSVYRRVVGEDERQVPGTGLKRE
ncbi:MAG TPA: hypothetical protein VFD30_05225 [Terriglobia bacterium]|jgi:glutamate-ammonia-ligase adenylyltransferase|nr:hypothetical protein [Terriglobia bacterium]